MNSIFTNPVLYAVGAGACLALAVYVGKRQRAKEDTMKGIAPIYDRTLLKSLSEKKGFSFDKFGEAKNVPNSESGAEIRFRAWKHVVLDSETFDPIPESDQKVLDLLEGMEKEISKILGIPASAIGATIRAPTATQILEEREKLKARPDGSQMGLNPLVGDRQKGWKAWRTPVMVTLPPFIVKAEA